ncbi:sulfotransferase 1C4-like [Pieris brassicae]|uniref:sulfotransferase 1C4-like n=1 Tax=Pieris brassicae TaxID=7116 RepID=UPI001E6604DE|nr:sulfotransferase 1C4-like [Pieris brassicae]
MTNENYPYEIKVVEMEVEGTAHKFPVIVRVGPKGYVFPENFKHAAADIYNMEIRSSDVFVDSFPRSGTTWTQDMVWLIVSDLDYERALNIPLTERYAFLEFFSNFDNEIKNKLFDANKDDEAKLKQMELIFKPATEILETTPSPRFIKTHLPLSLMPRKALEAKIVYVARDPRDAIVSLYHLINSMRFMNLDVDFKSFWKTVLNNSQPWTPYFDNVKEAWEKRDHPNMLFLFYEDMRKDLPSVVRRVSDFFGKKYNEEEIARLCDHLSFDNFKKNSSVNYDLMKELGLMYADKDFIRKGKTGGWRDYFDEEMTAEADKWIEENLRDTDLRFPSMQ